LRLRLDFPFLDLWDFFLPLAPASANLDLRERRFAPPENDPLFDLLL
jgi:hypothetical protein